MLARFALPIGVWELTKRTWREILADDVMGLSAQQAYYFLFSLFPALLTLVSLASFFPIQNLTDNVIRTLGSFAPPDVIGVINDQILKISQSKSSGILTFAFLLTLWSTSGAMVSIISTLNAAYDITEGRSLIKVRLLAILLTIGMAAFILVSVALIVGGPTIAEALANRFGLGPAFEWSWKIAQIPVVFGLAATGIALIYYFAPDAEQDWVWLTPGAVLATSLWMLSSHLLKVYLTSLGKFNETYGALGGFMALVLWFYVTSITILVGAELNAEIEHASPFGKAPGEKVPGQRVRKKLGAAAERYYNECKAKGLVA
jgi:membrane protein